MEDENSIAPDQSEVVDGHAVGFALRVADEDQPVFGDAVDDDPMPHGSEAKRLK